MMDRSFLSQPEVIAASRKWVCIRLATYENEKEARLLASLFRGGSGELENTVFALMSPDGKTLLATPGRSPNVLYRDASHMAQGLETLAGPYGARSSSLPTELPRLSDLRLALNVAACEGLPLIVVPSVAADRALAPAAWSPANLGRAVYVRATVGGYRVPLLVVPDAYGLKVEHVEELSSTMSASELWERLSPRRQEAKDHTSHVRAGFAKGVRWQTRVPVTDPQARY